MTRSWPLPALLLLLLLLVVRLNVGSADDWPQWGGTLRDSVWREDGIVDKFATDGFLARRWTASVGGGYSGPAVAGGRVFVTDRPEDEDLERVLCFDAETGERLWMHQYEVSYTIDYPAGPRATPLVHDGRVYAIGAVGHLICLSERTGEVFWSKHFPTEFGTRLPAWGMAGSPLIDGDKLIALVGGAKESLIVCFNRITGDEIWRAIDDAAVGYGSPVIFTFGGRRQLISWHPAAITSLDPESGAVIWEYPWPIRFGMTIATPRQIDDRLFLSAFYNGPLMLRVGADSADVVWKGKSDSELKTDGLHSMMSTPFVDPRNIFGVCSQGQLRCLKTESGERVWETLEATGGGRWCNAFIVAQGDRWFLNNEHGELIIADLSEAGYRQISRAKLLEPTRPIRGQRITTWSHPAFAMRSVFARSDKDLVRVDLSKSVEH